MHDKSHAVKPHSHEIKVDFTKLRFWDKAGIVLSGLCILHCIAIPALILVAPFFGYRFIDTADATHSILLGFILGIAGLAFLKGYRVHRLRKPVLIMSLGILLIAYATFFAHRFMGHMWEPFIGIIGSLFLIWAHYLNHKHCKQCDHRNHVHSD